MRAILPLVSVLLFVGVTYGSNDATKAIKLDLVFTTSGQENLQGGVGDELFKHTGCSSNVFLVPGATIKDAVKASHDVFCGGVSVDKVLKGKDSRKHWLVAYLGRGSSGTQWILEGVEIRGKTIRVSFTEPVNKGIATGLYVAHYYWAPVGELAQGTFTLELFDKDRMRVALMRRITIPTAE